MASPVNNHGPPTGRSNPSLHPSLRLASLSNPSLSTANLGSSPRRRQTPVSPLTLTPGNESNRCISGQFSPTSPLNIPTNSQGIAMDRSPLSLPPLEPPPPYPLYQDPSHNPLQHTPHHLPESTESPSFQPPSPVPCPPLDLNLANSTLSGFFSDPFFDQQQPMRQGKCLWQQQEQYDMYGSPSSSLPNNNFFDPNMNLQYSQAAMMGLGGSHGNLQDPFQLRTSYLYSNCGGSVPNIILTEDSNSLSKDIGNAVAGVSELGFDTDNTFQLDDELKLGPLSLDNLSMLSDPEMVLPDPTIEDTFRSDKLKTTKFLENQAFFYDCGKKCSTNMCEHSLKDGPENPSSIDLSASLIQDSDYSSAYCDSFLMDTLNERKKSLLPIWYRFSSVPISVLLTARSVQKVHFLMKVSHCSCASNMASDTFHVQDGLLKKRNKNKLVNIWCVAKKNIK
ncbi:unnamed protein product [Ranitomeya imitator]|uniref:Transducer of regulated CREB activity C-terminal domain-containing protein n=1 Tax=Ranitomeya imitator TaxID=111125 RepID=A0ABN9L0M5_9NEOB|nr:unnamed protein product [Ranitomeya imitator]